MRVLLIEHNEADVRVIREQLGERQELALEMTWADRLSQGLLQLKQGQIDIVLLDLLLPDSEGLETFRQIHAYAQDIPLIVLTALDDEALAAQAMRLGAQDYLVKGRLSGDVLMRAIRYAIERKQAESALRRSQASLAESQRIGHIGNWEWHIADNSMWWSDEIYRLFGSTPQACAADYQRFLTAVHPDDRIAVTQATNAAAHHAIPLNLDFRIFSNGQSDKVVHLQAEMKVDEMSRPIRMVGTLQDITERKRSEQALRDSEERTRLIVETALDAVVVMDTGGRITDWNPQACEIFGWSREEAIGRPLTTIIPSHYRETHERGVRHYLNTGEGPLLNKHIEIEGLHRNGNEFPIELTIAPVRQSNTLTFSAFIRDITNRKRAEIRQATQFAVSRALAESATLEDAANPLLEAFCTMMGWQLAAIWLVDRHSHVLKCKAIWHAPSVQAAAFVDACRDMTFSPGVGLPGRVWSSAEAAWISDVLADPNFPRAHVASDAGLRGALGFVIRGRDEIHGMIEIFNREVREPENELLQMMMDIGIKIGQFVERQDLERQLLHSQKMEAVGRLASGIAHDFNNLLTVINGYSELALSRDGLDGQLSHHIEQINASGQRAALLTRQLLAFSRQQMLEPQVLDLNKLVENIETLVRRLIGEDILFSSHLHHNLRPVKADPGQIEQVIMNLVVNARDAMPRGGRLILETKNVELDECYTRLHRYAEPGQYVMLAVSDTGVGMDETTRSQIFEPFFTTKGQGKGTGLGLSTVYGIIKQSGGNVEVYSELHRGTTFKVYLPGITEVINTVKGATANPDTLRGSETILLVEDEMMVRGLARVILEGYGYTVLETANGAEALRMCREHDGVIHLMVTDVVMPEMSGREVADQVRHVMPTTKVLYMSGFTDDAVLLHGVLSAEDTFLQKPFTSSSLAAKVRAVLDATTARRKVE
ncbi:MAG TPA: response regulator [Nitrospiraceae bacterium]|nr:response regulator [Nitrospiraceae bacterium]